MKLSKAEVASIIITFIFIITVIVVSLWTGNPDSAVSVTFQNTGSSEITVSPTPSTSDNNDSAESAPQALININTSTVQELCDLPGIGEVLAERIIAYRDEHGFFTTTDELMNVSGIGSTKYEDIKSLITVQIIKQEAVQ